MPHNTPEKRRAYLQAIAERNNAPRIAEATAAIGARYGQLTVIATALVGPGIMARVRCDCGEEREFKLSRLTMGRQTSCGHTKSRGNVQDDPLYQRWRSLIRRCRPGSKDSERYYFRGIRVCERWQDFRNFVADMGPTFQPGMMIERIDNNANYTPENCRWATPKEQARNRRNNIIIDTPWGRMTLGEAAERSGRNYYTLHDRWQRGDLLFPIIAKDSK